MRRASLSCAVSAREATDFRAGTNPVCRTDGDVLQIVGLVAVGLDLFNWDRGHPVTCNRLVRSAARLRGSGRQAQSYVGKRAVLKGVTGAYGSLGVPSGSTRQDHAIRLQIAHHLWGTETEKSAIKKSGRLTPAWTWEGRGQREPSTQQPCVCGRKRDRSASCQVRCIPGCGTTKRRFGSAKLKVRAIAPWSKRTRNRPITRAGQIRGWRPLRRFARSFEWFRPREPGPVSVRPIELPKFLKML